MQYLIFAKKLKEFTTRCFLLKTLLFEIRSPYEMTYWHQNVSKNRSRKDLFQSKSLFMTELKPKLRYLVHRCMPSSIYSCSIDHILEHEFCHLGCWAALWAVSEKFLKRRNFCLSMLLFGVVFSCFHGQKNIFSNIFLHCSVRTKKLHKIK